MRRDKWEAEIQISTKIWVRSHSGLGQAHNLSGQFLSDFTTSDNPGYHRHLTPHSNPLIVATASLQQSSRPQRLYFLGLMLWLRTTLSLLLLPRQCSNVCSINNDILPSICVVNPVLFGQKAARIRGCLCFQTVTREEQTGPGLRDIFMVPGGGGRDREREGGKVVTMGGWSAGLPGILMSYTDISIRCDLSFILISVIRLNFYNFAFSPLIWF